MSFSTNMSLIIITIFSFAYTILASYITLYPAFKYFSFLNTNISGQNGLKCSECGYDLKRIFNIIIS